MNEILHARRSAKRERSRACMRVMLVMTAALSAWGCAATPEQDRRAVQARLMTASREAVEILARESVPVYLELGAERFAALAGEELRRYEELGDAAMFRDMRVVPFSDGVVVCGEVNRSGTADEAGWVPFVGGALPGLIWSEFSQAWITDAANAAIIEACPVRAAS